MVGKIEFNDPTFRPAEDKLGGRNQMREKIAELIRELEKERKRSARWKRIAKAYYKREGVLFKTVMRYWYERAVVRSKYGNSAWEISNDSKTD